jgi:hypothetical protein
MDNRPGCWDRITGNIFSFFSLVVGVLATVVLSFNFVSEIEFLRFMLGLLILLAAAELIDKNIKLNRIHTSIGNSFEKTQVAIQSEFKAAFFGKRLLGEKDVVEGLDNLNRSDLYKELRALVYASPKSPDALARKIASLFKERRRAGIHVAFTAIVAMDFSDPSAMTLLSQVTDKMKFYRGVEEMIDFKVLDMRPPLGTDIVTVDDKHLVINLADTSGRDIVYKAIVIENQRDVVGDITTWFDKYVLPKAVSVDQAEAIINSISNNALNGASDK